MSIQQLRPEQPDFELLNRRSYCTACPKCSDHRQKQNTQSLSVYRDDDLRLRYVCHHPGCEWNQWQTRDDTFPRSFSEEVHNVIYPIPETVVIPTDYNGDKLYWYRDTEGRYLFANRRINLSGGGKVYVPFVYTTAGFITGKGAKWPTDFSGLYGAETISGKTKAVIVEGEKAADAAKEIFPDAAVVSWLGGAKNLSKADWSLLHGMEKIILWPDNDDAGKEAMGLIAPQLGADRILIADVSHLPAKADLADGLVREDIQKAVVNAKELVRKEVGVFTLDEIETQLKTTSKPRYTGYAPFDTATPLPGSGLVVIEGRTKHGKSALAVALTANMLRENLAKTVMFYSYEMTASKVFMRYLKTMDTHVTTDNYKNSAYFSLASDWVRNGKLKIVDQGTQPSLADLVIQISRPNMKGSVVVIDYLQIVPASTQFGRVSRQLMLKEMLDELRVIAHKNDILVFVLSQLTPDYINARNDSPREAKDIHYSADQVLRVWNKAVGESHPVYDAAIGNYLIHTYLNRDGESNVKYEASLEAGSKLQIKRRMKDKS